MDIEAKIRDYIASHLLFSDNGFTYDDATSFLQAGIVDSVGILELIVFVEKSFGISVADQDVVPANFDSVKQLAAYIRSKLALPA